MLNLILEKNKKISLLYPSRSVHDCGLEALPPQLHWYLSLIVRFLFLIWFSSKSKQGSSGNLRFPSGVRRVRCGQEIIFYCQKARLGKTLSYLLASKGHSCLTSHWSSSDKFILNILYLINWKLVEPAKNKTKQKPYVHNNTQKKKTLYLHGTLFRLILWVI